MIALMHEQIQTIYIEPRPAEKIPTTFIVHEKSGIPAIYSTATIWATARIASGASDSKTNPIASLTNNILKKNGMSLHERFSNRWKKAESYENISHEKPILSISMIRQHRSFSMISKKRKS